MTYNIITTGKPVGRSIKVSSFGGPYGFGSRASCFPFRSHLYGFFLGLLVTANDPYGPLSKFPWKPGPALLDASISKPMGLHPFLVAYLILMANLTGAPFFLPSCSRVHFSNSSQRFSKLLCALIFLFTLRCCGTRFHVSMGPPKTEATTCPCSSSGSLSSSAMRLFHLSPEKFVLVDDSSYSSPFTPVVTDTELPFLHVTLDSDTSILFLLSSVYLVDAPTLSTTANPINSTAAANNAIRGAFPLFSRRHMLLVIIYRSYKLF